MPRTPLFKVVARRDWRSAERAGSFNGAGVDLTDGFIHLSSLDQVEGTLGVHFAGQVDLLLIAIDPDAVAGTIEWEVSRGGERFPHLYGDLPLSAIVGVHELESAEGEHRLPADLDQYRGLNGEICDG